MRDTDLVNLAKINPNFIIDLRYATTDNFLKMIIYKKAVCCLRRKVADKLNIIQNDLYKKGLRLKILDAYRPLSVQKIFWEKTPDRKYFADPAIGSKHNRGAAVDVTLTHLDGTELKMPTDFDSFDEKASQNYMDLDEKIIFNRDLLKNAMLSQKFIPCPNEWWHFDDFEWTRYPIEDIQLEDLC